MISVTTPRLVPHWTKEPHAEFRVGDLVVTVSLASDELKASDALQFATTLASMCKPFTGRVGGLGGDL